MEAEQAEPATVALPRCLLSSATEEERVNLVQQMFVLRDAHPDTRASIAATLLDRSRVAKKDAQGVPRLITEACATSDKTALSIDGRCSGAASSGAFGA
jgi:hypothetical protein